MSNDSKISLLFLEDEFSALVKLYALDQTTGHGLE